MKNIFYRTLKYIASFVIIVLPCLIRAEGSVGVVNSLKGNAFRTLNGDTKSLQPGDHIGNLSEILTEEGGKVEFSDYFDNSYSLSGSGHIKFKGKMLILKRGYLWIKSKQDKTEFTIQTAHAFASYRKGEAIISFDEEERKTQLLVIKGNLRFGSISESIMSVDVEEGYFSFIKKDVNNERPRRPTPIGIKSFQKITSLFDRFIPTPIDDFEKTQLSHKTKQLRERLLSVYQKDIIKRNKKIREKRTRIIVNVFGKQRWKTPVKDRFSQGRSDRSRAPASLGTPIISTPKNDPFESALTKQYKKQTQHTNAVNSLIDALKSYRSDYSKSH